MADPRTTGRLLVVGSDATHVEAMVRGAEATGLVARGLHLQAPAADGTPHAVDEADASLLADIEAFQPTAVAVLDDSTVRAAWTITTHTDVPLVFGLDAAVRVARGGASLTAPAELPPAAALAKATATRVLVGPGNRDGLATRIALALDGHGGVSACSAGFAGGLGTADGPDRSGPG